MSSSETPSDFSESDNEEASVYKPSSSTSSKRTSSSETPSGSSESDNEAESVYKPSSSKRRNDEKSTPNKKRKSTSSTSSKRMSSSETPSDSSESDNEEASVYKPSSRKCNEKSNIKWKSPPSASSTRRNSTNSNEFNASDMEGESKSELLSTSKSTEGLPCTPESSADVQENEIQRDFKQLFLSKEGCDVIIKVKDQEFQAHKIILMARSPVLACAFRNEMKEKSTNTLEIDDCEPSSFSEFLCYLYSGIADISIENVFSLFTTADKYDVQGLRKKCLNIVKENLSVDSFCETIMMALLYSETGLIELATDFFKKHASEIVLTAKWLSFLAKYPTYGNELIIKVLVPDTS